jgi:heme A synthase
MDAVRQKRFGRLAAATAAAIYVLMIVGGVVRVTESGLGCPDWPLCYGRILPPPQIAALIEFSHRATAAVTGVLMLATFVWAWRDFRQVRWIVRPASLMIGLLAAQVPLGAWVVAAELEPLAVAFHLGMALLIFAAGLVTAVAARQPSAQILNLSRSRYPILIGTALMAVFLLLLSGALVVGSSAQFACPDWPLCQGGLLPPPNASPLIAIHLLHRYLVAASSMLVAAAVFITLRGPAPVRGIRGWALTLGAMFAAQVTVGAVQVALRIPPLWRALHLAAAAGVWAALVVLAALALLGGEPSPRSLGAVQAASSAAK